jgi:hypothetical protein
MEPVSGGSHRLHGSRRMPPRKGPASPAKACGLPPPDQSFSHATPIAPAVKEPLPDGLRTPSGHLVRATSMHRLFLLSLALGSSALGGDTIMHVDWRDDMRKKAYDTQISHAAVTAKSPAFDAESDELPLAPSKAVASARSMLAELVPNAKEWKVAKLELRAVNDPNVSENRKKTAYFCVSFLPPDAELMDGAMSMAEIVVLLTGEALRPLPAEYHLPNVVGVISEKANAKKRKSKKP